MLTAHDTSGMSDSREQWFKLTSLHPKQGYAFTEILAKRLRVPAHSPDSVGVLRALRRPEEPCIPMFLEPKCIEREKNRDHLKDVMLGGDLGASSRTSKVFYASE